MRTLIRLMPSLLFVAIAWMTLDSLEAKLSAVVLRQMINGYLCLVLSLIAGYYFGKYPPAKGKHLSELLAAQFAFSWGLLTTTFFTLAVQAFPRSHWLIRAVLALPNVSSAVWGNPVFYLPFTYGIATFWLFMLCGIKDQPTEDNNQ